MLLEGIGIGGYRSFDDMQRLAPLGKITLLAGQNNTGKSNVIRFLDQHLHALATTARGNKDLPGDVFAPEDHFGYGLQPAGPQRWSLGFVVGGEVWKKITESAVGARPDASERAQANIRQLVERVLTACRIGTADTCWWDYLAQGRSLQTDPVQTKRLSEALREGEWSSLWQFMTNQSGGGPSHWIGETLPRLAPAKVWNPPTVKVIPAIREIETDHGRTDDDFSGLNLISRLAKLQNPGLHERQLTHTFELLNQFLRNVLDTEDALLEVTHDRSDLLVRLRGLTLPLTSLGTGIHEVVILAAAATILRNELVCVEEPEIHLHPLLQRKLLRYLAEATDNQYVIATHSAHLLDSASDASVFHLRRRELSTSVDVVATPGERAAICADLGYRASDLVQANSVIWVEGPSDRIYVRHWIAAIDPELVEGIHYSIMFYGGRLLSHLTAQDDPEVEDFISLRRLNRYISIVIDSDKSSAHAHLNATKKRVREEFDRGPGFAWMTKGREIENYIDPAALDAAVLAVHPSARRLANVGQYDHAIHYVNNKSEVVADANKVAVAREVTKAPADLAVLDLRLNVERLARFIQEANDR